MNKVRNLENSSKMMCPHFCCNRFFFSYGLTHSSVLVMQWTSTRLSVCLSDWLSDCLPDCLCPTSCRWGLFGWKLRLSVAVLEGLHCRFVTDTCRYQMWPTGRLPGHNYSQCFLRCSTLLPVNSSNEARNVRFRIFSNVLVTNFPIIQYHTTLRRLSYWLKS